MPRTLTLTDARRLAIVSQRLAGAPVPPTRRGILETVRALRHLQIDPTAAVARSHLLVLWSRLGRYDLADLDILQWKERRLFEYRAFIYPIEAYPIQAYRMRHFGDGDYAWARRVRTFMEKNRAFRRQILTRLRREGPLLARQFEGQAVTPWRPRPYSWYRGRNVRLMLEVLEAQGGIMVAGRRGGQRLWDLAERVLPLWTPRQRLSDREYSRRLAEGMLRAAGVARVAPPWWVTAPQRGGRGPTAALLDLEREGQAERVEIMSEGRTLPGRWYVSTETLALLERLRGGAWLPRTTLLSPFDTLINDRDRTEVLFDFHFRLEIYVPKAKRRYGYFVMPILHGDRLIGRVAPVMLREEERLNVEAVYAETDAPRDRATGRAVAGALEDLAAFLGARRITYGRTLPSRWSAALRA